MPWFSRKKESEVTQSCPTLCNPMDCSLPGFSVHGIFQARILEWVAISFSRRSFQPRDWTQVSHIVGRCFTIWATSWGKSQEERIILLNGYLAMSGDIFNCQVWVRNAAKHLNNAQDKPLQQRNTLSKMSIMQRLRNPGLV